LPVYHFAVRSRWRSSVLGLSVLLLAVLSAHAQHYVEREVRIPWVMAGVSGLDALLVYADLPGKHPLALLTHGSSRNPDEQAHLTPWQELPQALWFARRGFVALMVVRRGYGTSGGEKDMHRCRNACKSIPRMQLETLRRTCAWPLTSHADCRRWMQRILSRLAFLRGDSLLSLLPQTPLRA
jgi:hypothetical protein